MNYGDSGLSASDVALLSGNNGRNTDGFGGDGSWAWVLIFLIFALGGFGRNGYGFGGGTGSGATDNYVLASDFATLQRQMDSGFDRIGNRITMKKDTRQRLPKKKKLGKCARKTLDRTGFGVIC